ncbi:hypothetical protein [Shewanella piezotolerans]|uniref:hypothetical protein n=1 Tax=Shewanella piezotolerans TaxID=404011 RepID=UPI0005C8CB5E|nr:hypothetical protein [Shewanella piezotolerans]
MNNILKDLELQLLTTEKKASMELGSDFFSQISGGGAPGRDGQDFWLNCEPGDETGTLSPGEGFLKGS